MIDFNWIVEFFLTVVQSVVLTAISVLLPVAIKWVLEKIKLDGLVQDDIVRGYLETALENSVIFAVSEVRSRVGGDKAVLTIKNEVIAEAVKYVVDSVPDALAHFGISEESLRQKVQARLERLFGDAE